MYRLVRKTGLIIIVAVALATAALVASAPVLPAASAQAQSAASCDYGVVVTVECTVRCTITIKCDPTCDYGVITAECTIKCSVTVEVCPVDPDPADDYGPGDFPDPPKDRAYASVVGLGGGDGGGPLGGLAVAPGSWALFGVFLSLVTAICAARRTKRTAARQPVPTPI